MEQDVRAPARVAFGAAMALLLLAGCLGSPGPGEEAEGPPEDLAPPPLEYDGDCSAALLFQIIDYAQTDRYLPPGFHPRDPQDFLTFVPVAFGQAGVIVLFVECQAGAAEPTSFSSVSIFVEPPFVEGYEPALFDFYEVDRYGSSDPYRPALRLAAWPEHDADVALVIGGGALGENPLTVTAAASDPEGVAASLDGYVAGEIGVGEGPVRFWHDSPQGLGVLEITTALDARFGGGSCTARAGTPLADFLGGTACLPPGSETIIATLPAFHVDSAARFLPGAHAE